MKKKGFFPESFVGDRKSLFGNKAYQERFVICVQNPTNYAKHIPFKQTKSPSIHPSSF
jgi:hypothetical protein